MTLEIFPHGADKAVRSAPDQSIGLQSICDPQIDWMEIDRAYKCTTVPDCFGGFSIDFGTGRADRCAQLRTAAVDGDPSICDPPRDGDRQDDVASGPAGRAASEKGSCAPCQTDIILMETPCRPDTHVDYPQRPRRCDTAFVPYVIQLLQRIIQHLRALANQSPPSFSDNSCPEPVYVPRRSDCSPPQPPGKDTDKENPGECQREPYTEQERENIRQARERALERVKQSPVWHAMNDSERTRCVDLMNRFADDCKLRMAQGLRAPTATQIIKSYDNLAEIAYSNPPAFAGQRNPQRLTAQLFMSGLWNIATTDDDQSNNPTCGAAIAGTFGTRTHPGDYTRMLADLAKNGTFTSRDGATVRPPVEALIPGHDELSWNFANASHTSARNLAGKWFQNGALNLIIKDYRGQHFDGLYIKDVENITTRLFGEKMRIIQENESPTGEQMLQMKQNGQLPAGIMIRHTWNARQGKWDNHFLTIMDVRRGANGRVEILLDDQHGNHGMEGWFDWEDNVRQRAVTYSNGGPPDRRGFPTRGR